MKYRILHTDFQKRVKPGTHLLWYENNEPDPKGITKFIRYDNCQYARKSWRDGGACNTCNGHVRFEYADGTKKSRCARVSNRDQHGNDIITYLHCEIVSTIDFLDGLFDI